ncbi:hypothetical protein FRC14_002685 [Serendipita sp. 396]|nr:hypothetical protein FRC14_002685 [Serendipita sp. 396]
MGYLFDLSKPPGAPEVYKHASMAKFSISLECVFARTTVSTIEAYILRLIFLLLDRDRAGPVQVYGHLGLVWRLIVSIGMHRDPERWQFDKAECQRRRRLFWEFVALDTWQYSSWGRPSSVHASVYDCSVPWLDESEVEGEEQRFQRWKFLYVRDILLDVLAHSTACGSTPTIGTVMKLDKRVRAFQLFGMSTQPSGDSTQPIQATVYQRNAMFCIKESTICFLHRPFFVSALNENLPDPLRSRFAGSCLAVHASASALLSRAHPVLDYQPHVPRFFVWWSQAFSGIPSVRKLRDRAQAVMDEYNSGRRLSSTDDTNDVLPGIIQGPMMISNAIFPAPLSCSVDMPPSISSETTPPTTEPEGIDTLVNEYLSTLQSELDQMARQHAGPGLQERVNISNLVAPQGIHTSQGPFYMRPSTSLLPSAPPLLSDAQTTPMFSPAMWTEFMASFGGPLQ